MESKDTRIVVANYLANNCPEELLKQFCNIAIHTNDFLVNIMDGNVTEDTRASFIINSMNCVSVITKFISLVGSGASTITVTNATKQTEEQDARTENKIIEMNSRINPVEDPSDKLAAMYDLTKEELNNLTPEDIVSTELENWGINPWTRGYQLIMSMGDIVDDLAEPVSADEVIAKIADKNGTTSRSVKSSIQYIINNAKFENSRYIPLFKELPRDRIDKNELIMNILDFFK